MNRSRWRASFCVTAGDRTPTTANARNRVAQAARLSGTCSGNPPGTVLTFRAVKFGRCERVFGNDDPVITTYSLRRRYVPSIVLIVASRVAERKGQHGMAGASGSDRPRPFFNGLEGL